MTTEALAVTGASWEGGLVGIRCVGGRIAALGPDVVPASGDEVLDAWTRCAPDLAVGDGGVYWQVPGPRFETAAEIRVLAAHADVVGMTVGSECVAMCELGLPYAAICFVDNLANGLRADALTWGEYLDGADASRARVAAALDAVGRALAGEVGS